MEADLEAYLDIYLNFYPTYKPLDAECREHYREKHRLELREDQYVKTVGVFLLACKPPYIKRQLLCQQPYREIYFKKLHGNLCTYEIFRFAKTTI